MTEEQQRQIILVEECKKGNRASKELLISSIAGFVYRLAEKKAGPHKQVINDLKQVGLIAILEKAIPKFDTSLNLSFLNYAAFWAVDAMNVYLNTNTSLPFRIPDNLGRDFRKCKITGKYKFKDTEYLSEISCTNTYVDNKGKEHNIFDLISYTEHKDPSIDFVKIIDKLPINEVHKDRFKLYYNLGKYKYYPSYTYDDLAILCNSSKDSIKDSLKIVKKALKKVLK